MTTAPKTQRDFETEYAAMTDAHLIDQVYLRLANTAYLLDQLGYGGLDAKANRALAKVFTGRIKP